MRNEAKFADKVLQVVEKIARRDVEKTMLSRNPKCSAIWHQPKRPKKKEN